MSVPLVDNRTILTPTGGFLKEGFTHSLNPYLGCSFAASLCGSYCYAQHNQWITRGRPWALYGIKGQARAAYRRDYDRLKRPRRGLPKPLRVYMSSSTDPYLPQEQTLGVTRGVLEEMLDTDRPPDVLVLQTRGLGVRRDKGLLARLSRRCELWLSVTVETDLDPVPGFPRHATPPAARLDLLEEFRDAGVRTQATLSPLLPLGDEAAFAARLDRACERIVVDHYLLGDGAGGQRTARTPLVRLLKENGFAEWTRVERMEAVVGTMQAVLGTDRVLVSAAGFNAVGTHGPR